MEVTNELPQYLTAEASRRSVAQRSLLAPRATFWNPTVPLKFRILERGSGEGEKVRGPQLAAQELTGRCITSY